MMFHNGFPKFRSIPSGAERSRFQNFSIGVELGGKDHTTVLHAVEKIQLLQQEDPKLRKTIETLTQEINA
jgi:chromosomal replication initiator protein